MTGSSGLPDSHHPAECAARIAELEDLVEQLRTAVASREQVGFACGVVAERYALSPTTAWSLLQRMSQNTNTKVREVARLVHADLDGGIAGQDAEVARTINAQIAAAQPLLTDSVVEESVDSAAPLLPPD